MRGTKSPNHESTDERHTPTRREFVRGVAAGAALLVTLPIVKACGTTPVAERQDAEHSVAARLGTELDLPPLPYAPDALAPVISAETVDIHYNRHHAGYAKKLAAALGALPATALGNSSLAGIIAETRDSKTHRAIFESAGQLSNHNLYWQSLTPAPTAPSADLMALITRDFGGMDKLKAELKAAALGQFGSGWAWLAARDGGLVVLGTPDAEDPSSTFARPLLTIDVWEHAYYVDYHNDRGAHVQAVIDKLLNWQYASRQLNA